MKFRISLGALALSAIAVAAVFRTTVAEPEIRVRRVQIPARMGISSDESLRTSVQTEAPVVTERVLVESPKVEWGGLASWAPLTESSPSAALEKKLNVIERELDLSPDQRRRMEQILARGEQEIAELQRGIVNSGVFRVREYDYQVRQFQALSYEEIAGVLDGAQRRRWASLMAEGRLGDAVLFEVLPTLVVLQD